MQRALDTSVADSTDLVWVESATAHLADSQAEPVVRHSRSLDARVTSGARSGTYRLTGGSRSEIEHGLREALATARVSPPRAAPSCELDRDVGPLSNRDLYDRRVARLTFAAARERLAAAEGDGLAAKLTWSEARVAIATTRGPSRRASVTSIVLSVNATEAPASGFARGVSRDLSGIDAASLAERARQKARDASASAPLPDNPRPIVLSPEAAADLLSLFGRAALDGAAAFGSAEALRERLGQPWLSPRISLDDDGHSTDGLPFAFDLAGRPKRAQTLIEGGVLRTTAVGPELAAALGLSPTPHYEAPGISRPRHLFLRSSGTHEADPLGTAPEQAIWIDRLERAHLTAPGQLSFRAICHGLREIHGGRLGPALPMATWDDDLERVFRSIAATGAKTALSPSPDGPWGAASSPALGIATGGLLRERSATPT